MKFKFDKAIPHHYYDKNGILYMTNYKLNFLIDDKKYIACFSDVIGGIEVYCQESIEQYLILSKVRSDYNYICETIKSFFLNQKYKYQ